MSTLNIMESITEIQSLYQETKGDTGRLNPLR